VRTLARLGAVSVPISPLTVTTRASLPCSATCNPMMSRRTRCPSATDDPGLSTSQVGGSGQLPGVHPVVVARGRAARRCTVVPWMLGRRSTSMVNDRIIASPRLR